MHQNTTVDAFQEYLTELNEAESKLTKVKLDLRNETEARRRLQENLEKAERLAVGLGRRPFIAMLIDADADCYAVSAPSCRSIITFAQS